MKERLFTWLNGLGWEVNGLTGLLVALGCIFITALLLHLLLHRLLLVRLVSWLGRRQQLWLPAELQHQLFNRLAFVLQGAVMMGQAEIWLPTGSRSLVVIFLLTQIWVLLFLLLLLFSVLDSVRALSQQTWLANRLPLRGIFQGVKLLASLVVGLLVVSLLIGKSPLYLFSGLGAMTAVLMLVFKDPLLGLVAGVQLSANRMLHVGDWLQMDKYGADGEVIDIGLTTVKVSNWDKTITTIPTYALISDAFRNWQGMTESGGRRIKRSLNIDMTSVRFLTAEEIASLKEARLLSPYLSRKEQELSLFNQQLAEALDNPINGRHLTNLGTFRAYVEAYLRAHSGIHQEMTLMVRQLAPGATGIPLELYCFTATTNWLAYETIQADIFDHLLAVMGYFHLRLHQTPTGHDLQRLSLAALPLPAAEE
ncbi:MAG: mechanosensitive ion channel family protein [Aeromonadaceae bacterium]|nr:mechanosensitive ion channel family protein [Aeromonadaceae bacterium]